MPKDTLLLFIELIALSIILLIHLRDDIIQIALDITDHLLNLPQCFLNLPPLNLTHLHRVNRRLVDSLQMNVTNLLYVIQQLIVVCGEGLLLL